MNKIAWEERNELGLAKALFNTVKNSLFNPSEFFKSVYTERTLLSPAYFTWFILFLSVLIASIFELAFMRDFLYKQLEATIEAFGLLEIWDKTVYKRVFNIEKPSMQEIFQAFFPIKIVFMPLIGLIMSFLYGLIMKYVLQFFVKDLVPYRLMFRIFAYGQGAALFTFIPVFGSYIYYSWHLFITYRGIMVCYEELKPFEAMTVVFAPTFIFMIFSMAFAGLFQSIV